MKTLRFLIIIICLFSATALANENHLDTVAVWEREDGGVSLTYFDRRDMAKYGIQDEDVFIQWYTDKISENYPGATISLIPSSEIPTDKKDRPFWSLKDGRVSVDHAAKAVKKGEKDALKSRVLAKLKLSDQDIAEFRAILREE